MILETWITRAALLLRNCLRTHLPLLVALFRTCPSLTFKNPNGLEAAQLYRPMLQAHRARGPQHFQLAAYNPSVQRGHVTPNVVQASSRGDGIGDASILRLVRLLRLARMTRVVAWPSGETAVTQKLHLELRFPQDSISLLSHRIFRVLSADLRQSSCAPSRKYSS